MIFYQDLDRYKGNIYIYDDHSEEQGGHWVVIVGWQDDSDVKNGGYWICRNSWGEKWGENGYFNIAYGECGIDDFWFVYGIFTIASAPDLHSYSFHVFLAELSPALPIGHSSAQTVLGPSSAGFPRRTEALVG